MFELIKYVQEHYAASGLQDGEFAAQAASVIGAGVVTNHIYGIREDFGIGSNRDAARAVQPGGIVALELRVAALERRLDVYLGAAK
jgi:hypothetical protein